jgi:hypothetical protein
MLKRSMLTVEEIKAEVIRLARKIGAQDYDIPFYPFADSWEGCLDFAVDQRGYHLLNILRGKEESRFSTSDADELLYKTLKSVVWNVAQAQIVQEGVLDQARAHLKHEVAVFAVLSSKWAERREQELEAEIL